MMKETVSDICEEKNKREETSVRKTKKPESTPYIDIDGVTTGESSTDTDEAGDISGASLADLDQLLKRLGRGRSAAADTEGDKARARGQAAAAYFEEGNWQWNSQYGDLLPWIVSRLDLASSVRLILKIDGQHAPVVFGGDDACRTHEIVLCRSSVLHLEHYYPDGANPGRFPGDGDCFYRAFLYCLLGYADADAISHLRDCVVSYIRANLKEIGEKIVDQYYFEGASALDKSASILKKSGSYEDTREGKSQRATNFRFGETDIIEALPESRVGKRRRLQTERRKELRTLQENYHPERTRQRLAAEYEANRLADEKLRKTRHIGQRLQDLWAWIEDVFHYGGSGHRQGFEAYRNSAEAIRNIDTALGSDEADAGIWRARSRAQRARQRYLGAVLAREVNISLNRIAETERAQLAHQDDTGNSGDDPLTLLNKIRNSRVVSAKGQQAQEKIDRIRKEKKHPSAQERLDKALDSHEEAKYFYRLFAETFAREYRGYAAWLGAAMLTSDAFLKLSGVKSLEDFATSLQARHNKGEDEKADTFFRNQEKKDAKLEEDWANQRAADLEIFKASLEAIVEEVNEDGSVNAWNGNDDGYEEFTIDLHSPADASSVSASSASAVAANMNAFLAPSDATSDAGVEGALFSARTADTAEASARSWGKRRRANVELQTMVPVAVGGVAGMVADAVHAGGMDGAAAPLVDAVRGPRNGHREGVRGRRSGRSRLNALFWIVIGSMIAGAVVWAVRTMVRAFSGEITGNASSPGKEEDAEARTSEAGGTSATEKLHEGGLSSVPIARWQDQTTDATHVSDRDIMSPDSAVPEQITGLAEEDIAAATEETTEKPDQTGDDPDYGMQGDAPEADDHLVLNQASRRRLKEMIRRQIRHEFRVKELPRATAEEWGTREDGSEADTIPVSRVRGTSFNFGDTANQTLVFQAKPGRSWTFINVASWLDLETTDIRDMFFYPLILKGYLIEPKIYSSDPQQYIARIKISKKGEAESTLHVSGDKTTIDRMISNLVFLKENLFFFDIGLKSQEAERYRKFLEGKIIKVYLSKERNPVTLKKKTNVLIVDEKPLTQDTNILIAPVNDEYIEFRVADFYYLFTIGYFPVSVLVASIGKDGEKYKITITFKKQWEDDLRFHVYPIDKVHADRIKLKMSLDENKFWRETGEAKINFQLMEPNVLGMDKELVIETSNRTRSVINIPQYSEKPKHQVRIKVFNPNDIFVFPRHPKGIFVFELMKLKNKSGKKIDSNVVVNILNIRDADRYQLNLTPSHLNKPGKLRDYLYLKKVIYTGKDWNFSISVMSEGDDESLYREMEKKINQQIITMEEAEFNAYQFDVSLFASQYFKTKKNIDVKHVISRNKRAMLISSDYESDFFEFNELKNNVTFLIANEIDDPDRTANVLLGVSLGDSQTLIRRVGSKEFYLKVFKDNYSGANIIITTGDLSEREKDGADRDRTAVRTLANKMESSALKRKADLPRQITRLSTAASVILNEDELRECCILWDSLPEWAQTRALRFHMRYRKESSVWHRTKDGIGCPDFSIIRDALILVKDDFIQDKKEELNWSVFPEAPEDSSTANSLYRIKIVPENKNDISNYAGARYWSAMRKSEAEELKATIEKSDAKVAVEFAIENWVNSAAEERRKWSLVTARFSAIAEAIRKSHPDDAKALDALLKRMNGISGNEKRKSDGLLSIASYPSSYIDLISEKEIRDELYSESEAVSDLKKQHSRRHDLINRILLKGVRPEVADPDTGPGSVEAPHEPAGGTPVEPAGKTPVKPGGAIPVEPAANTPVKPAETLPDKPADPPGSDLAVDKPDEDAARKLPKWVVGVSAVAGGGLVVSGTYWGAHALLKSSLGTLARFLRLGVMSTGFVLFPTVAAGLTSAASAALFGTGMMGVLKALGITITKEMLRRALFVEIAGCGTLIVFSTGSATDAIKKAIDTNEGQDILDAIASAMAAAGTTAVCAAGAGSLAKGGQLGFVHRIRSYDNMVSAAGYTGGSLTAASGATTILQCLMGYCPSEADSSETQPSPPTQTEMLTLPDFAMSAADDKWTEKTGGKNISMSVDAEGKLYPLPDNAAQTLPRSGGDQKKPPGKVDDSQKTPGAAVDPAGVKPPTGSVPQDSSFLGGLWASFVNLLAKYSGGGPNG